MANKRMLDRAITRGGRVRLLSDGAALLYTWAIPFTDDFGRINGDPEVVWADLFSLRRGWTSQKVGKAMLEWVSARLGVWYRIEDHYVFQFDEGNFEDFQKGIIHKRTTSKYPHMSDQAILITSENLRELPRISAATYLNLTKPNLTKPILSDSSDEFTSFWESYPRKEGKKKAVEVWKKLNPDTALTDKIVKAVEQTKRSGKWSEAQFIPLPASYLNGERWNDEVSGNGQGTRKKVLR